MISNIAIWPFTSEFPLSLHRFYLNLFFTDTWISFSLQKGYKFLQISTNIYSTHRNAKEKRNQFPGLHVMYYCVRFEFRPLRLSSSVSYSFPINKNKGIEEPSGEIATVEASVIFSLVLDSIAMPWGLHREHYCSCRWHFKLQKGRVQVYSTVSPQY